MSFWTLMGMRPDYKGPHHGNECPLLALSLKSKPFVEVLRIFRVMAENVMRVKGHPEKKATHHWLGMCPW